MLTILLPPKKKPNVLQDHSFANSMIFSWSTPKEKQTSQGQYNITTARAPLAPHEMHANIMRAFDDLIDVIHYYYLVMGVYT